MRDIEDYSQKYSVSDFEIYQVKYRRKLVIEQIKRYNPQNILEIGCGYEPLFKYVPDICFTIVEPSLEFYENAKKLAKEKKNISCIMGEMETVSDELPNHYDMIICSGLLHEVEEPVRLLHSIEKVCNDETIVHFNVPNSNSMHRLLALESGLISNVYEMSERNKLFQQNNNFDMKKLTELMGANNMEVVDKGSYFVKPFTHSQMYELISKGIISEQVLGGLYNIVKYMPELGSEIYVNCRKKGKKTSE